MPNPSLNTLAGWLHSWETLCLKVLKKHFFYFSVFLCDLLLFYFIYSYINSLQSDLIMTFTAKLKPWSNGIASKRKLRTWVYLRLRLARAYVHLRWLAMTCPHFGRDQICTQVDASFSPFGHPTQVNASWETSINLLLASEIEDSLPLNVFFWRLACTCEETCEPVWPPNASLYASSTCVHLRLLAGPFAQGFRNRCLRLLHNFLSMDQYIVQKYFMAVFYLIIFFI